MKIGSKSALHWDRQRAFLLRNMAIICPQYGPILWTNNLEWKEHGAGVSLPTMTGKGACLRVS